MQVCWVVGDRLRRHVPAVLGALAEDLGALLAVVMVVLLALLGTLFAGTSTCLGQLGTVIGVANHEPGVQRRDVRDVAAQPDAPRHVLTMAGALISTPLAGGSGFVTNLDALAFVFTQVVDVGEGV